MKHNRNPLATAIHSALGAGVVAGLAMTAAPVFAQDQDQDEAMTDDRIVVTGSRIVRDDLDGAVPVQIIDRATIEFSGKTSVADLLRNQPINSGGSFRPQSGSTAQSFGGLSLRALGEGRTLILIDGRRAPTAPNVGSGQDLNAIPLAAVERIEILSDGASAIYGSDAIGGVVNIITRQDFTGAELMIGTSDPKRKGGETREASAIVGAAGADGRILAGVSNNKRDIIFQRDREWSAGGNSIFSNNFLNSDFTFLQNPEFGSANVPGCEGEGFFISGERCFYDFTLQAADEAEIENQSLFVRGSYDINPDWTLNLNSSVTRVKSFGRYAPVPSSPWLVGGFGAIVLSPGLPNHPATSPDDGGLNPNWQAYQDNADDTLLLTHRFAANGPRDTNTDASVYDLDLYVTGQIGDYGVEFGARRVESQYNELGRNYIVSALAQPQFDSGAYNIYDPFGNSQEVLQSFTATINRDARFVSREYRGLITGDLFEMANGPVGFAFGAEYRDENYKDIFDDLQANGNITGSSGNSAFGDRDRWAAYGELLFPVLEDLEVSLAGRYDDYSDFGTNFSPKISLRWDALDTLAFRASYGEGFRAPPLDVLSAQPSFSADSVEHVPTGEFFGNEDPSEAIQVTGFVIANPDIGAEASEQFSFGTVFEPTNWLSGTLDYWNIKITDRVASIGAQQIINCLEGTQTNCPPGLSRFPTGSGRPDPALGLGAEFGDQGQIVFLQRGFASLGTIESDGIDASVRVNWDFGDAGTLRSELNVAYTMSYEIDSGEDVAGEAELPDLRAVWANSHSWGDFNFAWNINYVGPQDSALSSTLDGLPSWVTHDLQASYFTPWNGRITVGVDNLVDKDPVLDPGEGRGFNFGLYNGYGRITYLRYTQNF
ncbi:MAG: TonB-dependent receptor plug domain-containing protein [Wenzhouxiangella sp.]